MKNAFKTISENIALVRGDTLTFPFDLQKLITEDAPAAYAEQDLTSCAFCCKRNYDDEENAFEKTLGNGIEKVSTGKYRIRIAPDDTAELDVTNYYYELEIGIGTDVFTIMRGVLELQYDINPSGGGGGDLGSLAKFIDGTLGEITEAQLYGATKIRSFAFWGYAPTLALKLPSTVVEIEDRAFAHFTGLTSITLPNSIKTIGTQAFNGCSNLESINIPDSVTRIGDTAFSSCSSLTSISIPNSITNIGNSMFNLCKGLTSVTLPETITSIENRAFFDCTNIETFTMAATIPPTIETKTFYNMGTMFHIYVPAESVDAYKAAPHWSNYASKILPISQN